MDSDTFPMGAIGDSLYPRSDFLKAFPKKYDELEKTATENKVPPTQKTHQS